MNTIESDISLSNIDINNSVYINDQDSQKKIKELCYELVRLPNEPKYSDYIEKIFKEYNNKIIIKNTNDKIFCEKLREIKEYAQNLRFFKKIKISDFKKMREFAISKGGFLTYDVRKIFYKKAYLLNHSNVFNMLYIDYDCLINRQWDYDKIDLFSQKRISSQYI